MNITLRDKQVIMEIKLVERHLNLCYFHQPFIDLNLKSKS